MNKETKYFGNFPKEEWLSNNVFMFESDERIKTILIKNSKNFVKTSDAMTDNLHYSINGKYTDGNTSYYFHTISCLRQDNKSKEQFQIIYDYLFKAIDKPQAGEDILNLIESLETLFNSTPSKDLERIQTITYLKLLFHIYCYKNGLKSIYGKFNNIDDPTRGIIQLNSTTLIILKGSLGSDRIHRFNHDVLTSNKFNLYFVSVLLEKNDNGVSLYDLFSKLFDLIKDPTFYLYLEMLKIKCAISSLNKGVSYNLDYAMDQLEIFKKEQLPILEINSSTIAISNIEYDIDCKKVNSLTLSKFKDEINKNFYLKDNGEIWI